MTHSPFFGSKLGSLTVLGSPLYLIALISNDFLDYVAPGNDPCNESEKITDTVSPCLHFFLGIFTLAPSSEVPPGKDMDNPLVDKFSTLIFDIPIVNSGNYKIISSSSSFRIDLDVDMTPSEIALNDSLANFYYSSEDFYVKSFTNIFANYSSILASYIVGPISFI